MFLLSYFHTGLRINHNHTEQMKILFLTKGCDEYHKYIYNVLVNIIQCMKYVFKQSLK
jgi:hypothetical protein